MNVETKQNKLKIIFTATRIATYLLVVMLVFSVVSILCEVDTTQVYPSEDGVVDLTETDFNNEVVTITFDAIHIYDYAFYMPEDFASGSVTQEAVRLVGVGPTLGDYGTIRILLRLPAENTYAISAKNTSYAQRMFIDGKEYPTVGVTGDNAEAVTPKTLRYTVGFQPESEITEIILHYSNFVHSDTGGYYLMDLGHVNNITHSEQLKTLRIIFSTATLITAALFFFGMYLFFQRGRYFLWFSLACGCIAVRGVLTGDKALMLLFPNLNWYFAIRLEYLATCSMALFSALYLNALFPSSGSKWAVRGFTIYCMLFSTFVCLTQPLVFTQYSSYAKTIYVAFCVYLLIAGIIKTLLKKTTPALPVISQSLLLIGFSVYVLLSWLGINAHNNAFYLWGLDYPQVGMMVFLFLNILALVLGFSRTQQELDEALRNEREMEETNQMLERLNRIKSEFLGSISHELKTPLEVICGCAGLTRTHIERNMISEETFKKLDTIEVEAMWVAQYADELLAASLEKERRLTLSDTDAETLLQQAAESCALMCRRNNNKIVTKVEGDKIPLRLNLVGIHHVLLNLILNASKHTRGDVITLSAKYDEAVGAVLTVSDNGGGIPSEILPLAFERGVSGDGSSGFGLAICKRIVMEHGGEINIESSKDIGTTVYFTLPCTKEGDKE